MQHKDYYDGRDYSLNPLINLETMLFSLNLFNNHWYKVIQVFYNPFSGEKEKWRGGGGGLGKIAICSQGVQLDSAMVLTTHSLHFSLS